MQLAHGLEHTENSPHGCLRQGETGEFPLFSVSRIEKLASVFSQPVAIATGC
jgi:hypothetical protein